MPLGVKRRHLEALAWARDAQGVRKASAGSETLTLKNKSTFRNQQHFEGNSTSKRTSQLRPSFETRTESSRSIIIKDQQNHNEMASPQQPSQSTDSPIAPSPTDQEQQEENADLPLPLSAAPPARTPNVARAAICAPKGAFFRVVQIQRNRGRRTSGRLRRSRSNSPFLWINDRKRKL